MKIGKISGEVCVCVGGGGAVLFDRYCQVALKLKKASLRSLSFY